MTFTYRCEACGQPAKHHTNYGAHYCDQHWADRLRRGRIAQRLRAKRALESIERSAGHDYRGRI